MLSINIETSRLLIRKVISSDDVAIYSAVNCPEIHFMHNNEFTSLDKVQQYIKAIEKEYDSGKYRTMAIADKRANTLLGLITLDIDSFFPRGEISYWIADSYRNAGYATEAVTEIIAYGFNNLPLNRIQAMHFPDNIASGRVLIKSGMKFEGNLRQYIGMGNMHFDCLMYAVLRKDFTNHA